MATPRVFISSTCYDLKHIRENLKYFVRTIGYEPVMSDNGDVFYDPNIHTHDSCLKEVETCQLFILIIGGRYGGTFKDDDKSITNNEYKHAVLNNIPIFTLVEQAVYSDHHVYTTNKKEQPEIAERINYPSIDNQKIFHFIDEVRKNTQNNAIYSFKDFADMEIYLKKQWAGMMYDFLIERHQKKTAEATNNLLNNLAIATQKSEELIKVLIKSSKPNEADKTIEDINNKVEAENFVKLIFETFNVKNIKDLDIEKINYNNLPENWFTFLEKTDSFFIDQIFDEDDDENSYIEVIFPRKEGIGQSIVSYSNSGSEIETYGNLPKIQKAYESFKKVNKNLKKEILNKLKNGF